MCGCGMGCGLACCRACCVFAGGGGARGSHLARPSPVRAAAGVENNAALKRVFRNYCKFALGQGRQYTDSVPHMNMQQFHRCGGKGRQLCGACRWEAVHRLGAAQLDVHLQHVKVWG
eukprot:359028-Chlamydomonas_euryale.AAC.3